MRFTHLAGLAEVLLVLAAGNLIGELAFSLVMPASILDRSAPDNWVAFSDGLLIFMRLGTAGALGLGLLYWRSGVTPRQAGLSRAGHSVADLIGQGMLLGLVSSALICILFAAQELFTLGEGLPAWRTYSLQPLNTAFLISLLGTSILIPPLTEEIMTRGYMRTRLVEAFGPMAGVLLTALVFGLSHTRYISTDPMLFGFLVLLLFNSFIWTYSAQRSGSIIPPFIAHAMANGIGTAVLFNVWWLLVVVLLGVVMWQQSIRLEFSRFMTAWRGDDQRRNLWSGLLIVMAILVSAFVALSVVGRTPTLLGLGVLCLLVTIASFIKGTPASVPEDGRAGI